MAAQSIPASQLFELSVAQQGAIDALQHDDAVLPAPRALTRRACLPNDVVERADAAADPDAFWAERARLVEWMTPWRQVCRFEPPNHAWYIGGRLNATVSCIDRHVHSDRRNKAAILWIGEDGDERTYTYARLYREVNRFANALRRLVVQKGDRVIVYMPLVPEGIWGDHARYEKYWEQVPGCYSAGDVAVRDADGYFAVLGRADDVMNVAGHRIGTADVEGSLARHPAIAESAVVGLPDELKGERIKAFVVLRQHVTDGPGLVASLRDHVRQDLGPIATPAEIEVRSSLPKTRSGKILRRVLKAQTLGQDAGDLSTIAD